MRPGMMLYFERTNRAADRLTDAQFGAALKGLLRYAQTGEELVSDDIAVQLTFDLFRDDIDTDAKRYDEVMEKRRRAGIASGEARRTHVQSVQQNKQMLTHVPFVEQNEPITIPNPNPTPKPVPTPIPNPEPKEDKRDKSRTAPRFKPPTIQEVTDYCQERGNKVDPQRFIDFYEAKGWRVGNTPMKDWKAAVRTWEQRDRNGPTFTGSQPRPNPALQYTQRQYTTEEANDVFADPSKFG